MSVDLTPVNYTITSLEAFLFFPACGQRCGTPVGEIERPFFRSSEDRNLWVYDASDEAGLPGGYNLFLKKMVVPSARLPDGTSLSARVSDVMEEYIRFEWPGHCLSVQAMYKNLEFKKCNHFVRVVYLEPPDPTIIEKTEFKLSNSRALGRLYDFVARSVPDVFFKPLS